MEQPTIFAKSFPFLRATCGGIYPHDVERGLPLSPIILWRSPLLCPDRRWYRIDQLPADSPNNVTWSESPPKYVMWSCNQDMAVCWSHSPILPGITLLPRLRNPRA